MSTRQAGTASRSAAARAESVEARHLHVEQRSNAGGKAFGCGHHLVAPCDLADHLEVLLHAQQRGEGATDHGLVLCQEARGSTRRLLGKAHHQAEAGRCQRAAFHASTLLGPADALGQALEAGAGCAGVPAAAGAGGPSSMSSMVTAPSVWPKRMLTRVALLWRTTLVIPSRSAQPRTPEASVSSAGRSRGPRHGDPRSS